MTKAILSVLSVLFFCSCTHPYVDFNYELACSEKLLEYVTPVVTYKGNSGMPVTFEINESDWTEQHEFSINSTVTVIINGEEKTQDLKCLYWKKIVEYGDDDFTPLLEDELIVKYKLKEGVTEDMLPTDIYPTHCLTCFIELRDEDKDLHYFQSSDITTSITVNGFKDILDEVNYQGYKVTRAGEIDEKEYKEKQ